VTAHQGAERRLDRESGVAAETHGRLELRGRIPAAHEIDAERREVDAHPHRMADRAPEPRIRFDDDRLPGPLVEAHVEVDDAVVAAAADQVGADLEHAGMLDEFQEVRMAGVALLDRPRRDPAVIGERAQVDVDPRDVVLDEQRPPEAARHPGKHGVEVRPIVELPDSVAAFAARRLASGEGRGNRVDRPDETARCAARRQPISSSSAAGFPCRARVSISDGSETG
jgi:hypothetical protein